MERLESIKRRIEEEYRKEVEKEGDARFEHSIARLIAYAAGRYIKDESYGSVVFVEKKLESSRL